MKRRLGCIFIVVLHMVRNMGGDLTSWTESDPDYTWAETEASILLLIVLWKAVILVESLIRVTVGGSFERRLAQFLYTYKDRRGRGLETREVARFKFCLSLRRFSCNIISIRSVKDAIGGFPPRTRQTNFSAGNPPDFAGVVGQHAITICDFFMLHLFPDGQCSDIATLLLFRFVPERLARF